MTMAKIVKLSEPLANQIAAGEVVERPASVVKELVENAIDAHASQINIDVEDGGLQSIRITDNGNGIPKAECLLAFERHATSKIQTERDLYTIRTLGFRGEALPSIASVSHLQIKTGTGKEPGLSLKIEGGVLQEQALSASRKGTEVIVSRLFYNTPARLKYMKTVHTELGHISTIVNRLALAHPTIAFQLKHNRKQLLKTTGNNDLQQVMAAIYGLAVAKKMVPIQKESLDFKLAGLLGKPDVTRSTRQSISIFLNGRYVRNYPIYKAIQAGYHTLLPIGRFPIVSLYIEMDPILIDVNVHPAKLEVRLSKEQELTTFIQSAIQEVFSETDLIPRPTATEKTEKYAGDQQHFAFQFSQQKDRLPNEIKEKHLETMVIERRASEDEEPMNDTLVDHSKEATHNEEDDDSKSDSRLPPLFPFGQMHGTYIFAQNENGLYIIDQHAAQERVKYEFYRKQVGKVAKELQELLLPITFEFTQSETLLINDHLEELEKFGVFLESFGKQTFIVRTHPQWFPNGEEERTIRNIIELLLTEKSIHLEKMREETAIMMACKRSIKANHFLQNSEILALLESLGNCQDPFTCPHGRPVIVQFTTYEMEKMFKRVM